MSHMLLPASIISKWSNSKYSDRKSLGDMNKRLPFAWYKIDVIEVVMERKVNQQVSEEYD